MTALTLIIGNKNYSSWSLRPWLAMKQFDLSFAEVLIPLYKPESRSQILQYCPSGNGKVPICCIKIGRCGTRWQFLNT